MIHFMTAALSSLILVSTASADIKCSGSQCAVTNLPLFNQNSSALLKKWSVRVNDVTETNLCVPAAAAMAIQSLISSGHKIDGDIVADLRDASADSKIEIMAKQMKTSRTEGTFWDQQVKGMSPRGAEFSPNFSVTSKLSSTTVSIDQGRFLGEMKAGRVPVLVYGHYWMSCKNLVSGTRKCVYTRKGGHAVAVKSINGSKVTVNDPNKAKVYNYSFGKLPTTGTGGAKLQHVLPALFSSKTANYIIVNGDYVAIVDSIMAIGGKQNL